MTQEDKKLLLKDLCGRLPYGIICEDEYGNTLELNSIDKPNTVTFKCSDNTYWTTDLDKCKPYLLPLSSMTKEQERQYNFFSTIIFSCFEVDLCEAVAEFHDWFNRNHFDYRGLIEKGLAIDATNKNIY